MKTKITISVLLLIFGLTNITDLIAQNHLDVAPTPGLYGMTQYGGTDNLGTIFHYTPSTGIHTLDISLQQTSGINPAYENGLTDGGDGNFYGLTSAGGTYNYGIIFQWNPGTNAITKKFDFDNAANGGIPYGSLTLKGGNLYGMTSQGGTNGYGVIFEWNPATNTFTKKIDFDGTNGNYPYGSLTINGDKFYGMTFQGGVNGMGVIFEWDPSTNTYVKKFDFDGTTGSFPFGSLTLNAGKLYGMTNNGGANLYYGVIFEFDPVTDTFIDKFDFDNTTTGYNPYGSLTCIGGVFYGMTWLGGTLSGGVLFKWDPVTGYTPEINFDPATGAYPYGSLTYSGSKFYGLTYYNISPYTAGVIFEWDPTAGPGAGYTMEHAFTGLDGSHPQGNLTLKDGKFYGVTQNGGTSDLGVIFEWDPASTPAYTKKIDFMYNPNQPCGSLTRKGDKLYGMTINGGAWNSGAILEYDPATNSCIEKFDFDFITGAKPFGALTLHNGKFYGMTNNGGASLSYGVIFEWDPVTNTFIDKFDFDNTNGGYPNGNLTFYNGIFYGMTPSGGANSGGVLFKWDPETNIFTKIRDLDNSTGWQGYGSLTLGGNKLYGLANGGGLNNRGVIFELDPATDAYTVKANFDASIGYGLRNALTLSNGKFYGVSQAGGGLSAGVLFDWDPLTGIVTIDGNLDETTGSQIMGSLTLSNGKFYGAGFYGGSNLLGVIFEWDPLTNTYLDKFDFNGADGSKPLYSTLLEYTLMDTWTGAINSDWANTGNWSTGVIPTSSSNVLIPDVANDPVIGSGTLAEAYDIAIVDALAMLTINSGGSLTMKGTLTNTAGDAGFVIQSGASFKHTNTGANGTALRTVEKDSHWHLLSCPINQASMPAICDGNFAPAAFDPINGATYDFFSWQEPFAAGGLNWINLKNPDWSVNTTDFGSPPKFLKGKGYLVEYKSDFAGNPEKLFNGTLGVGTISIPVTKSPGGNSYNLIGNAYPSYVDWKAFGWDRLSLEDDAGGKDFWVWNDAVGNYGVYNSASAGDAGTNGVTRYIAPEQGFFVKASSGGNVTMTDDIRCHSTQAWLKSGGNNLRITTTSTLNGYSDEVMLEFGHSVTGGAEKWFSMYDEAPSLYLPVGMDNYSLRFLGDISESPVVPLCFKAGLNGNYTITANGTEEFTNVILQDLKTGTIKELKADPSYTFTSSVADDVNRFLLKFNAVGIEPQETPDNGIYIFDNMLTISNPGETVIQVYNMIGQKILEKQSKNETLFQLQLQVPTGYYIVKVTSDKQVYSTKVFVK